MAVNFTQVLESVVDELLVVSVIPEFSSGVQAITKMVNKVNADTFKNDDFIKMILVYVVNNNGLFSDSKCTIFVNIKKIVLVFICIYEINALSNVFFIEVDTLYSCTKIFCTNSQLSPFTSPSIA